MLEEGGLVSVSCRHILRQTYETGNLLISWGWPGVSKLTLCETRQDPRQGFGSEGLDLSRRASGAGTSCKVPKYSPKVASSRL